MLTARFIRHAQSLANAGGRTGAPESVPLTEHGREQAERLSWTVESAPDLIICSPYVRARKTAMATTSRFPEVPFEIWPVQEIEVLARARRIDTNAQERRPWIEAYWTKGDPDHIDGTGAESYTQFVGRVRDTLVRLNDLANKTDDSVDLLIFSHGQFMKGIQWEIAEVSPPITPDTMRAFYAAHQADPIPNIQSLIVTIDHAGIRAHHHKAEL